MEAAPLPRLSDVLAQEHGEGGGEVHSGEGWRCSPAICALIFQWWLRAITEAAKAW